MYARFGDIDDIMMVTILSDVRNSAKSFEELRTIGLCGKVGPP